MIKCEVIKEFTLGKFEELKNIQRKRIETKGKLYVGDIFECTKEMADYLMGNNKDNETVVKVIEVIPAKVEVKIEKPNVEKIVEKTQEIAKPKTTKKKKSSKK